MATEEQVDNLISKINEIIELGKTDLISRTVWGTQDFKEIEKEINETIKLLEDEGCILLPIKDKQLLDSILRLESIKEQGNEET